jgi:hypothetical protein
MDNKDLLDAIDNSVLIESFKKSDEWKLIEEACNRLANAAQEELLSVPADNMLRIVEMQCSIRLYRNVLKSIVNSFTEEGEIAFNEAKERALIKK